jgi:hypothetical protein
MAVVAVIGLAYPAGRTSLPETADGSPAADAATPAATV